jgi:hypothetical protein
MCLKLLRVISVRAKAIREQDVLNGGWKVARDRGDAKECHRLKTSLDTNAWVGSEFI